MKKMIKRIIFIILIVLLSAVTLVSAGYVAIKLYSDYLTNKIYQDMAANNSSFSEYLPQNPIDFAAHKKVNNEIYAWITVPGTKVDYPILQNENDDYYLTHSVDGKYYDLGSIYTQAISEKDFSDAVTPIYGHNSASRDLMFTTLHYFQNEDFFNEHEYFYIYTETNILTYRVVSAFKFDDRHILNAYDINDTNSLQSFYDVVMDPVSLVRNVREDITLTAKDKLVVLSTCVTNEPSSRYLVCGVLTSSQQTK